MREHFGGLEEAAPTSLVWATACPLLPCLGRRHVPLLKRTKGLQTRRVKQSRGGREASVCVCSPGSAVQMNEKIIH